jgi:NADH-quinone oxidoreductase subunit A
MLTQYFPILLFVLVGLAVGVVPVALGWLLGPSRPDAEKLSPYECGFEAFEDARMKFDVRYYLRSCSSCSIWRSRSCFPGRWC